MAEAKTQNGNSLAAVAFSAFAGVCIVAFLAFRGDDIGRLPTLIGGPSGSVFGTGAFVHLLEPLKAILIGGGWLASGWLIISIVKKRAGLELSAGLEVGLSFAVGAAVWSLIWFFLGLAGLYSLTTAIIAICVAWAAGFVAIWLAPKGELKERVRAIFPAKKAGGTSAKTSIFEKLIAALIFVQLALSFIASLAPPVAKDTLLYHFALPKAFIAQGGNGFVEGNIASYLSLGSEMHVVWSRLLAAAQGADSASGAIIWIFFPGLLFVVYRWAREIGISRLWSLIATASVATIPTAYHVAASGYVDLSLALYITLAVYSLTRWWKQPAAGWAILSGILLGAALSVKLTTLFVIAAFALIILLRARPTDSPGASPGKIAAVGFAGLLLATVIASPWYIRTWAATGSPVFPFYMSIWPGEAKGWDVERSNLFQAMNSQYGGADTDKLNYLTAPVRVSIVAQPELSTYYDGVLGAAFLIGLPLLVWALWKLDLSIEVRIMAGVAGIMYLFWLFSSEQIRYLLPVVPLLAIAMAASAERIGSAIDKAARFSLATACLCASLTSLAWFLQKAPLRVVLGGETRDEYLTRNLDYYPYYRWLNTETPPSAKVWLVNMRRDTYDLERPYISDYFFEDWTLRKMIWDSANIAELRAKVAATGAEYLLTRHDFLFDYDRSTIVDDRRSRAENDAKLALARSLILDRARTVRADEKFSLVKLF